MSESPPQSPSRVVPSREGEPGTSGWVGWIAFAGFLLVIMGVFQVVQGLTALFAEEYFAVGGRAPVLDLGYTAWGWIHLGVGCVVIASGFMVFAAKVWARAVGTAVAGVSALSNMVFMPEHPAWSLIVIALAVVVIFALTVHGSEIKP